MRIRNLRLHIVQPPRGLPEAAPSGSDVGPKLNGVAGAEDAAAEIYQNGSPAGTNWIGMSSMNVRSQVA
jgi:hypothetical protein